MATIEITKDDGFDDFLKSMPQEFPRIMVKAVRKGGNVVKAEAKKRAPVGDPSHHPDKKPLKDTIIVRVQEYAKSNGVLTYAIVGPSWPDGAHGHLIELGHKIVTKGGEDTGRRTTEKRFMAEAGDTTEAQYSRVINDEIAKGIREAGG